MLCGVAKFNLEISHLDLENKKRLWLLWWSFMMMVLIGEEDSGYMLIGCPSGTTGSPCGWRRGERFTVGLFPWWWLVKVPSCQLFPIPRRSEDPVTSFICRYLSPLKFTYDSFSRQNSNTTHALFNTLEIIIIWLLKTFENWSLHFH